MRATLAVITAGLLAWQASTGGQEGSVQVAVAETPSAAIAAAEQDRTLLPPTIWPHIRYLSLAHTPRQTWTEGWKTLNSHCQRLSTKPNIRNPIVLSCLSVARIDIRNFGWSKELWDRLALTVPHWLLPIKVSKEPAKTNQVSGQQKKKAEPKKEARLSLLYEGETAKAFNSLSNALGTEAPLLFADHFVWQTAIQYKRNPGFYDFIGLKNEKDLNDFLGYDPKVAKRFQRRWRDNVMRSSVAYEARRIDGEAVQGGILWVTSDQNQYEAVGDNNPLLVQNLDGSKFKFAAREILFPLPNQFVGTFLSDAEGNRQDFAPDKVARQYRHDTKVHINLTCYACHSSANANMYQPVNGFVRTQYRRFLRQDGQQVTIDKELTRELRIIDDVKAQRLDDLYFSPIEEALDDSRRAYVRALARTNGRTPSDDATAYVNMFEEYDFGTDLARASREIGCDEQTLTAALRHYIDTSPETIDPVLEVFLRPRKEGQRGELIPITQWHEAYPNAVIAVGKYKAMQAKKEAEKAFQAAQKPSEN